MKAFCVVLIFLAGTVFSLPYHRQTHQSTRRLLHEDSPLSRRVMKAATPTFSSIEPPRAKKVKHEMEMFGDVRNDNYYWLRDDSHSDPQVLAYLHEENNYTDLILSSTKQIQDQIYADIKRRIKEDDITIPGRRGPYYYYQRTLSGKDYLQYCRRLALNDQPSVNDVMLTGPDSPPEHVMLDVNTRAQGHANYSFGGLTVSPNHKLVVYTEDINGDHNYTAYVIDAETRYPEGKALVGLTYKVVWAGNESLIYMTTETHGQQKVWLHKLGEEQANDLCLYHQKDDTFSLDIVASESKKFVFVVLQSSTTSFIFYFDNDNPEHKLMPLTSRMDGIQTWAHHSGTHFFIEMSSDGVYDSQLLACPVSNVSALTTILPHRESVSIAFVQLFSDHLVVSGRENGLTKVFIYNLPPLGKPIQMLQIANAIEFMNSAHTIYPEDSDYSSSILRYSYTTMGTPRTVFDYDMNTGMSVMKNIETVLGGFDSSNYFTETIWATAPDDVQVPMSIVYRKDLVKLDGRSPLVLWGFGAHEYSPDPVFQISKLPLLDRGFVYAIAHVRGGGEMGSQWFENGKLLKKNNTFSDFVACAGHLIKMKYTTNESLVIHSIGAGGMLIGAVLNSHPDLFKAAILEVPFLDVLTTLLDPNIKSQWEEWGDPRIEIFYNYIKSYSPVDNVSAHKYPSILVTTSLNAYTSYSDSAKFVAKLRDLKTDESLLLLKCELNVGPSAKSGRSDYFKDEAFRFAFMLKALNMIS